MKTRQDYLNQRCSHREYYAQFVNQYAKSSVLNRISQQRLQKSTDAHFNDIELSEWDNIWRGIPAPIVEKLREAGDSPTLSGSVCILKEAARQIVEGK